MWGATTLITVVPSALAYFNPRSPCGERPRRRESDRRRFDFNPRSPCGERRANALSLADGTIFQSTLPVWGATGASDARGGNEVISIHAPRVGSDRGTGIASGWNWVFQSTLPVWGATRVGQPASHGIHRNFNPRSPCGERLDIVANDHVGTDISIHAPRVGSDMEPEPVPIGLYFNPRSPCGERLAKIGGSD